MNAHELNKIRPFIFSCLFFSFLLLAFSGMVLFFKVRFLGGLGAWRHGHDWFSVMFMLSFLAYFALGRKTLKHHVAVSTAALQWLAAIFMCLVFLVGVFLSSVDRKEWRPDRAPGGNAMEASPEK